MSIYNRVQLYSENSNIKYPLSDTHTMDVPDDLIVDMSVSIPPLMDPSLVKATNIICRQGYAMVSLEAGTTPIAHAFVLNPQPFVIYPMTCSAANNACIVFGPGVDKDTNQRSISMDLDPRVVLPKIRTTSVIKLAVNGFEYDMPQTLTIEYNNFLQVTAENRVLDMDMMSSSSSSASSSSPSSVSSRSSYSRSSDSSSNTFSSPSSPSSLSSPSSSSSLIFSSRTSESSQSDSSSADDLKRCMVIKRNDTTVSDQTCKYGLIDRDFSLLPIYKINSVKADANGNIDIILDATAPEQASFMPIVSNGANIGLLAVTDNMQACDDPYKPLMQKIKDGLTGYGSPYELPLDIYALENDTSSSESGPWGPE